MKDSPIPPKPVLAELVTLNIHDELMRVLGSPIPTKPVLAELVTLNIHELMKVLGVRRTSLGHLRQDPDFPKPIGLTRKLSWRAIDIQRWLEQRMAKTEDTTAQPQQQD